VAADYQHFENRYAAQVASIPHLRNEVNTPIGREVMDLIRKNPDDALRAIVECRGIAGLTVLRATTGERVCTGSLGAKQGWRLP
jgi:hypothetical protein